MSNDLHPIQRNILNQLLFGNKLKYSQLKPEEMEGSQFTFHLNKLISSDLVIKEDDFYALTPKGKNVANTFDSDSVNPNKQAKHSVVFCAFRKFGDVEKVLVYTRKKNPFYDHQGFPTGKVMYGEEILKTAERELHEETGLTGKATLVGIRHYRVYFPTEKDLVEDKVMYVCRIDEPIGELLGNLEGVFVWVEVPKIKDVVTNPLPEFEEILDMLSEFNGQITFNESKHYPKIF